MRLKLSLVVCALALAVAYPLAAGDNGKKGFDPAKLVGKWKYASGEKAGEKLDVDKLKKDVITITKDTWTLQGQEKFVMKYTLDTKKTPVSITLEMTESPFGAGAVAKGIIELKGDELRICYAPEGDAPKAFKTEGSKAHLFVLKRAK